VTKDDAMEPQVDPGTEVRVPVPGGQLVGDLALPSSPAGVVAFAHGSGSSRRSRRNQRVAADLRSEGLGTLLLDLLTEDEEVVDRRTRQHRFDIPLLALRMVTVVDWLRTEEATADLPIGLFGASTGAAAALVAAAVRPDDVDAVVSRGGRPDLAAEHLARVQAPTLLIVGGADPHVLQLNQRAQDAMVSAEVTLEVVPGATHLFEEPGALEEVADLAAAHLCRWLA
jgi:putative phosphoribosyl transferase